MATATVEGTPAANTSEAAAKVIASSTKWAAGAAIVPVPYVDLLAIGAVQAQMVHQLAKIYGQDSSEEVVKGLITALLGTLAPAMVSTGIAGSSIKLVPGVGTLWGTVSMAVFASAATYAIGKIFAMHFQNGGTLSSFSAEAVQEDLEREFNKQAQQAKK